MATAMTWTQRQIYESGQRAARAGAGTAWWREERQRFRHRDPEAWTAGYESERVCLTCAMPDGMRPTHDGSPRCASGSIASGGTQAHCTCDTCF